MNHELSSLHIERYINCSDIDNNGTMVMAHVHILISYTFCLSWTYGGNVWRQSDITRDIYINIITWYVDYSNSCLFDAGWVHLSTIEVAVSFTFDSTFIKELRALQGLMGVLFLIICRWNGRTIMNLIRVALSIIF